MATALIGGTLVPSMALLRDGMELSRKTDELQLLSNYAVQTLETQLGDVAANWTKGTPSGDFAADGFPRIRYNVTTDDAPASGGITDQLMVVKIVTYIDDDDDDVRDTNEASRTFRTKIAKILSYDVKANN